MESKTIKLGDVNRLKHELTSFGVYQITCLKNERIYIGSTCVSFFTRLRDHYYKLKRGDHLNIKLQRSFNKHGLENFVFEILKVVEDKTKVRDLETRYMNDIFRLSEGQTVFNSISFNICQSGIGSLNREVSQFTRDKIRNALIGKMAGDKHPLWGTKRTPTMLGKKHTPETLAKMRGRKVVVSLERRKQVSIQMGGANHPLFGKPLSEKRKKALDRTGMPCPTRKSVYKFQDNIPIKKYEYIDLVKLDGYSPKQVSKCARGKAKQHGGFKWGFTEAVPTYTYLHDKTIKMVEVCCCVCHKSKQIPISTHNRLLKNNRLIYCNSKCMWVNRRKKLKHKRS